VDGYILTMFKGGLLVRKILLVLCFLGVQMVHAEEKQNGDIALFAMGCFWCGEVAFKNSDDYTLIPGVLEIKVGYSGGETTNPTYPSHQGHYEVVQVKYDPNIISYQKLLEIFWRNIDPFDSKGQFCDKGASYLAAIFYHSPAQQEQATRSKQMMEKRFGQSVIMPILEAKPFYLAEDYHQEYHLKNPLRYKYYRWACRRDQRLQEVWGE